MTRHRSAPVRVRMFHVEWLLQSLSARDWRIIETVNKLRLVTGLQLERTVFTELTGRSRSVVRWRTLKRLVSLRVLMPLRRRIGGAAGGSAKLAYSLDSAGQWLMQIRANQQGAAVKVRRPGQPGERFVEHTLAVAELYASLEEQARNPSYSLVRFVAEPAAWWPNGFGGWMKPDALAVLATERVTDYWWCEIDMATESLTTIHGKLMTYLDFLGRGQLGPDGLMPRVLVATSTDARREAIAGEVARFASPAGQLFLVTTLSEAPARMAEELRT